MEKFAVFTISEESFGIGIDRAVEIIRVQKIFTIPGLPDFLSGVMSVRGAVIPLLDLRKRFGMDPSHRKERIIIVRFEKEKIGFLVDEIKEIISLTPDEILPPPSLFRGFKTEYITGLGKKGDRIIILLNIDNILSSEERIILHESMGIIEDRSAGDHKTDQR